LLCWYIADGLGVNNKRYCYFLGSYSSGSLSDLEYGDKGRNSSNWVLACARGAVFFEHFLVLEGLVV